MVSRAILNGWPLVPPSRSPGVAAIIQGPSISGTFAVGQTLIVSNGTWGGFPTLTYSYQWLRNGLPIDKATGSSYTLVDADGGTAISAVVVASNPYGNVSATTLATLVPVQGGGGAAKTPRLMSSRTVQPGFNGATGSNGTTDIDSNTRTAHDNESGATITKLKLLWAGYRISTPSTVEIARANDFIIQAAIEYPAGTFSVPVTINVNADNVLSPEIPLPTPIPPGAQFWVRSFVQVTSGQRWLNGYVMNAARGEVCDRNTGIDKTVSGTITGTGVGTGPIAIVATDWAGTSKERAFCGFGDSLVEMPQSIGIPDIKGNSGAIGYACSGNVPYMNLGRSSRQAQEAVAANAKALQTMQMAGITDVYVGLGTNDAHIGGRTLAQISADLLTLWTLFTNAGMKVHARTIPPLSTVAAGSNIWIPGSQTPVAWMSTLPRSALNSYIKTARPQVFASYDVGASVEAAGELWATSDDITNARIMQAVKGVVVSGSPTTTVVPTNLVAGNGIPSNGFLSQYVVFRTGANAGIVRQIASNTAGGASITLSAALPSNPAPGDTFDVYRSGAGVDGIHWSTMGHNSVFSLYYGGAWVVADILCNALFGKNATA